MEYMPKGDLRLWTDRIEIMNDELAARVARQMLDAISFLHERGITHRDIKPDNILVAGDHADDKIFKLADFGLSKEVITEQTFMQTFCGTLLYLAPEVYPGFERAKAGLPLASTKRKRTSPERPYEHSVDIWSLGVVLYHALAGKPPFPSNQYTGGELFLDIVMAVRVDYEFLIWCGVGKEAIDFLKRMIVVDAQFRAHESDLMTHPFLLKEFPSVKGTPNEAQDLDASQLSLADDNEDEEGKDDPRKTKRIRSEIWTEQHDDLPESFRAEMSEMLPGGLHRSYFEPRRTEPSWRLSWGPPPPRSPSVLWPGLREAREAREREARNTDQSAQPEHPERLFGEIGSSALRSSGVLGQDANLALEVPMEVGSDDGNEVGSFIDPGGPSNHTSAGTTELNTSLSGANVRSQQNIQYPELSSNIPHNSAAPSLLGAEALVGQLNMTSPESRASAPSVGSKPATPKTPLSPNASNVEHHSQDLNTAAGENEKRHPETTTTPSLGHTQNPSAASMAEHRSSASKASSGASMNANTARHESPVAGSKSKQSTQESSEQHHEDGQQTRGSMKSNSPATASNSQDFAPKPTTSVTDSRTAFQSQGKSTAPKPPTTVTDSKTTSQSKDKSASQSKGKTPAPPPSPTPSIHPTLNLAPPTITTPSGFLLPTPRFGNLILTKPSMPSVRQIKITSMGTSFGRNPDCTYVHPNIDDRRVPKNAFDIQMWYPGIDRDLAKGKDDWAGNKELTAVISTRTAIYIKVNGVRLMKGRDCWLFGRLRTGDIVSVVELPEGQIAQNASDREVLQFRCEFFIGKSKSVRKEGEAFVVEMEDRKGVRTQGEAAAEGAGEKKGV